MSAPFDVIDLFAGPGGLSEGFSSLTDSRKRVFRIRLSIEKDSCAHQTLTLRSFFRQFVESVCDDYYEFMAGRLSIEELYRRHPRQTAAARLEAWQATLGETRESEIDRRISSVLTAGRPWVLIGGPPCQAYSLVGRARRMRVDPTFADDPRHVLYRQYLRILRRHKPQAFVMENVKGLLSSTHAGERIFRRILRDIEEAGYEPRSLSVASVRDLHGEVDVRPADYVVRSERYGVPQHRHRVIILGIRKDLRHVPSGVLVDARQNVNAERALAGLPPVRGILSREPDSFQTWYRNLADADWARLLDGSDPDGSVFRRIRRALRDIPTRLSPGTRVCPRSRKDDRLAPAWAQDDRLKSTSLHESREHIAGDFRRYMFAAAFADVARQSPRLESFPVALFPEHRSAKPKRAGAAIPFRDRFRVQLSHEPASTVTSHLAKDGHYFIHFRPEQARSMTVREAARLQTFPDNYMFLGPRTEQYRQVGNAVPPLLARQIAAIVGSWLTSVDGTR